MSRMTEEPGNVASRLVQIDEISSIWPPPGWLVFLVMAFTGTVTGPALATVVGQPWHWGWTILASVPAAASWGSWLPHDHPRPLAWHERRLCLHQACLVGYALVLLLALVGAASKDAWTVKVVLTLVAGAVAWTAALIKARSPIWRRC